MTSAHHYLRSLNEDQRRAIEYEIASHSSMQARALLVIAGTGSGKSNTFAHWVAHLIVCDADTRRILLLTFSCRAAAEMRRRVQRLAVQIMGDKVCVLADALTWTGTYHGIGASLLHDNAEQMDLDAAFTIHGRDDPADIMNLASHEHGFSRTAKRFPTKGTCLAVYSRCFNAQVPIADVLRTAFAWCAAWEAELRTLFAGDVEAKQSHNVLDHDDLLPSKTPYSSA